MGSSSYQMQPSVQNLAYKVRTDRSTDPQSHYLIFLSKDGHKNSYHSRILLIGTCSLLYFLKKDDEPNHIKVFSVDLPSGKCIAYKKVPVKPHYVH